MQITKSKKDKSLFGVCGGIANYLKIPSILVRIIFIFTPGFILLYLFLNYYLPEDKSLY
ncbi:PspC domain-containing protein [Bacillus solitudinis]|uniref:PspC domain-containing protein n=1 Tax=Bacillus solitudinis TaxID=2014074 RepID=UPI000C233559|nr:PspC domain-containing protein [Bacillus solitudinis]